MLLLWLRKLNTVGGCSSHDGSLENRANSKSFLACLSGARALLKSGCQLGYPGSCQQWS